jgi:hypothetical protein
VPCAKCAEDVRWCCTNMLLSVSLTQTIYKSGGGVSCPRLMIWSNEDRAHEKFIFPYRHDQITSSRKFTKIDYNCWPCTILKRFVVEGTIDRVLIFSRELLAQEYTRGQGKWSPDALGTSEIVPYIKRCKMYAES